MKHEEYLTDLLCAFREEEQRKTDFGAQPGDITKSLEYVAVQAFLGDIEVYGRWLLYDYDNPRLRVPLDILVEDRDEMFVKNLLMFMILIREQYMLPLRTSDEPHDPDHPSHILSIGKD